MKDDDDDILTAFFKQNPDAGTYRKYSAEEVGDVDLNTIDSPVLRRAIIRARNTSPDTI